MNNIRILKLKKKREIDDEIHIDCVNHFLLGMQHH